MVLVLHGTAPMLARWLGETSVADFRATVLRQRPYAAHCTARDATDLCHWGTLVSVLAYDNVDAIVVASGEMLPMSAPATLFQLGAFLEQGIGLCLRGVEKHHPRLARVARAFEAAFPGAAVQVQLFVTPGGTRGFSWHYDDEDVFIAQTAGVKDYFFRDNTVAAHLPAHSSVFHTLTAEQSQLCTAQLHAGDFLYLPARMWHMAEAVETSLSISVGVRGAA